MNNQNHDFTRRVARMECPLFSTKNESLALGEMLICSFWQLTKPMIINKLNANFFIFFVILTVENVIYTAYSDQKSSFI
jgi:hypothetical protein